VLKPSVLLRVIDAISDFVGKITSFLMILVTGYVLYSVIRRYIFHWSWNYMTATSNFFLTYFSLGAAYVYNSGAFIKVDILTRRLPVRTRAILNAVMFILFFFFCLALLWTSVGMALPVLRKLKFSLRLFNPVSWPMSLIVPIGIILLTLQGLAKFIHTIITAVTGKENA